MNKIFTPILILAFMLMAGTAMAQRETAPGVTVGGSVFGGGNLAAVGGNTEVTVDQAGARVANDVYGGGALANVGTTTSTTIVTLEKGIVARNIYGGGLGQLAVADDPSTTDVDESQDAVAAMVNGNVQVVVNGGSVGGNVFGCNNVNGTPLGTVTVTINGSAASAMSGETTVYAIKGVYGGGNQAHYVPTTITKGYPLVTVNGCSTSIANVFGGGKAAGVSQTKVVINGGDIGRAFAGGDGDNSNNTPAHIGYKSSASAPTDADLYAESSDENGIGDANIFVKGGTIGQVFGGSNKNGIILDSVNIDINKNSGAEACAMHLAEVYGGGNMAPSKPATTFTIGCTGSSSEGITYLYGGANQADVTGDIVLDITDGHIENVFGGNNASGAIDGTITVNINQKNNACSWYVGNVYGGGNHAAYSRTPDVNIINGTVSGNVYGGGNDITTANKGVNASDVEMTGGTVLGGVYGGCNLNGYVETDSEVKIYGGVIGSQARLDDGTVAQVFGGGLGENTKVNGNVTVTISRASGDNPPAAPTIYGDVYGGSALGEVNNNDYNVSTPTTNTTVNIYDGLLKTKRTQTGTNAAGQPIYVYTGGNVFGGGLGRKTGTPIPAKVYGPVTVNIGNGTPSNEEDGENFTGSATIEGNIYGCNNTNGSPQQNVTVNIFKTAQTDGTGDTPNNTINGDAYALANVFGGGNEADFQVEGKTATVNVYGCNNTIARTFGGGNAAASNEVFTMIQGGRVGEVFSGGNGEVSAANVNGNVNLTIHGGNIGQTYGGSNQQGAITGEFISTFDNDGPCEPMLIEDHYCGGKFADYEGNINATIQCSGGMNVRNLYGGCKQAHVVPKPAAGESGNITLTVYGGHFENIYGGSEGTEAVGADIAGNVTLNVYGGTVTHAIFGGSNIKGAIGGTITVNVEDKVTTDECPLDVSEADVYGGGNRADYPGVPQEGGPLYDSQHPGDPIAHTSPFNYPAVNIKNATVKNVFGGGLNAEVTGNPQIQLKNKAVIRGNVYGGGNMGEVNGNPKVILNGKQTN